MDLHKAEKIVPLHGGAGILTAVNGVVGISWETAEGKRQKSVPKALKGSDPDGIRRVQKIAEDVRGDLSTWKGKIERYYLEAVSWSYEQWRRRYADHGTLSLLARRLIWRAEVDGGFISFVPTQDGCLGLDRNPLALPSMADVTLWHPLQADTEEIAGWRQNLMDWEIVQPFRQAWREVYRITDAERATESYSNRFAGHVLKQHQMRALAIKKGWTCPYRTGFDSPDDDPVYVTIPSYQLQAEYWTSALREVDDYSPGGAYWYIKTDRLKFHAFDAKARHRRGTEMPMQDVPPIVFSEVMRHCDLFTAVAAVSLDPEWADRGAGAAHPSHYDDTLVEYWRARETAPLPPSAETRRDMLKIILASLPVADRVSIEGMYVRVRGTRHTYLIHIGSSAVRLEGRQAQLCIVPDTWKAKKKITLPFDTDVTLSAILSKIMLLANDEKIKDPVILVQLL
ncbi:MAG: DUF4132 domain-containing protein [Pseudomonadota bacterium]